MLALDGRILEIGLCVSYLELSEHAILPHFQDVGLLICKYLWSLFLFYFTFGNAHTALNRANMFFLK